MYQNHITNKVRKTRSQHDMAGVEAIAIVQLIDACIGIARTIISIGLAIKDSQGLPPKL